MKAVSVALGNKRLLRLAAILERVPKAHPKGGEMRGYDQGILVHPCGSPACAWGWWLYSDKSRRRRIIKEASVLCDWMVRTSSSSRGELTVMYDYARFEFGITAEDVCHMFSSFGCRNANTGAEAAQYIRDFVARRPS